MKITIIGGTGLIGKQVIKLACQDDFFTQINAIVRSPLPYKDPKIENVQLNRMDVFQFLTSCKQTYDIIFAGPPYALNTIDELPKMIVEQKLIAPDGYFILEHTPRNDYTQFAGYSFQRNYGTTIFSFFACV